MRAHLVGLAAVAAALLTACGSEATVANGPAARAPEASSSPHWPSHGCAVHSSSIVDYAADAHGAPSRQAALARYVDPGTHVVREKPQPHHQPRWLVVRHDRVIVRAVTVERFDGGWLVSGVETCSR